jgi:hypothetical protein
MPKIRFATWYIRTLNQRGRLDQVFREIDRKWTVELRWNQSKQDTNDGKLLIYSGVRQRGLSANISNSQSFKSTFQQKSQEKKEAFYNQLDGVLSRIPKRDVVMLMGEMNCQNGSWQRKSRAHHKKAWRRNFEVSSSKYVGITHRKLAALCPRIRSATKTSWHSNDHVTTAQLDHICISSKWNKSLLNVRVIFSSQVFISILSGSSRRKMKNCILGLALSGEFFWLP